VCVRKKIIQQIVACSVEFLGRNSTIIVDFSVVTIAINRVFELRYSKTRRKRVETATMTLGVGKLLH